MKISFINIFIFLPVFFFPGLAAAQEQTVVSASLDKNKILIGEPLHLVIQADIPARDPIRFVSIDSIDHFEFLDKPVIDTINTTDGTTLKGVYRITSFDSGQWVIPAFVFSDSLKTDTIPVTVVFSDFNPEQDYHDVKDILAVQPVKKKEWWYYVAAAGLLLVLLLYWLLRKKKKKAPAVKEEIVIDPYEEAQQLLMQLKTDKPETKEYYSRLTGIFRLYIFRKKGLLSLQKTTDDLVVQLKGIQISKEQYESLSQSLRLSDFVKFAKYIPAEEDKTKVFEVIKNSIDSIEKIRS